MEELISRKAAIEAVKVSDDGCTNPSERCGIIFARVEARRAIKSIPSIPAVPLDKLCEWLEDNASLRHGTSVSRHSWKQMITSDLIGEKNEE